MADPYDVLVEAVAEARRRAIQSLEAVEARAVACRPYLVGPRCLLDRLHAAGLIGRPEETVLTNGLGIKAPVGAGWVFVGCSLPRGDGQAMIIVTDSTGMPTFQRLPAPAIRGGGHRRISVRPAEPPRQGDLVPGLPGSRCIAVRHDDEADLIGPAASVRPTRLGDSGPRRVGGARLCPGRTVAMSNRRGVSPRPGVAASLVAVVEDRQERLLRDLDVADLLHPLLAFLLLLEQLALAGDVAAVALGGDVLAEGRDRLAGDDLAADGGLERDLELVAVDLFLGAS